MQPPKNQKEVRSFLGLVKLSKYTSIYAMITTKIRSLLHKGVNFLWSKDHQNEFERVIASLSNLYKIEPFNPENEIYTLVDASLNSLGFILFQKDSKGRSSILQAGSTSLKHAQVRWSIPELKLLAVK